MRYQHEISYVASRCGATRTVSAGAPDADPALVDEPVDLLHEPLRAIDVLFAKSDHRRKWRYERPVGHIVAGKALWRDIVSKYTGPARTLQAHLHMVEQPCWGQFGVCRAGVAQRSRSSVHLTVVRPPPTLAVRTLGVGHVHVGVWSKFVPGLVDIGQIGCF